MWKNYKEKVSRWDNKFNSFYIWRIKMNIRLKFSRQVTCCCLNKFNRLKPGFIKWNSKSFLDWSKSKRIRNWNSLRKMLMSSRTCLRKANSKWKVWSNNLKRLKLITSSSLIKEACLLKEQQLVLVNLHLDPT